jgi:hypothetical protein
MNSLSHWANRNRRTAIGLLVLLETIKITAGMNLGRYGLPALPPDALTYLTLAVVAAIFTVQRRHRQAEASGYLTRSRLRRDLLLVFQGGYLLSILAGNACQNFLGDPGGYPLWSAQSLEMRRDTISPETVRPTYYAEQAREEVPRRKGLGWRIAAYTGLTLLGFFASFFAIYLACVLACSNQGVLALVALVGIIGGYGVLGALAFQRLLAPQSFQKLGKAGRRREIRGLLVGIILGCVIFLLTVVGSPG